MSNSTISGITFICLLFSPFASNALVVGAAECTPVGAGVFEANLVVTTNDLDEGTVSYPLTCTGVSP